MTPGEIHGLHARVVADLKEQLEQQRTRAEAAELELRELRRVVDKWKEADAALKDAAEGDPETCHNAYDTFNKTEEALRHA